MLFRKTHTYNTEADIISACSQGDSKGQKLIYEQYAPKMYGVCLRYLKSEQDAEDVLTNGFMKIFDNIDKFRSEGSFEGWIRRIMVNEALGFIRKNRNLYVEVNVDQLQENPDFQWEDQQFESEEILLLVQNLPSGYRTVFNLYAVEGYSHKEIASQLGISENTSKSQLSRARALLQDAVIKEGLTHRKKG